MRYFDSVGVLRRRFRRGFGLNPYYSGENSEAIEVLLRGGLGNQLFGYATAYQLSVNLKVPLRLITNLFEEASKNRRSFELSEIVAGRASFGTDSHARQIFREKGFCFDSRIFGVAPGTLLDGYFQSSSYFESAAGVIRSQIRSSESFQRGRYLVGEGNFISLQMRRGDYASPQNKAVHGIVPESYFMESLDFLRLHLGNLRAVVFSDDFEVASSFASKVSNALPFGNDLSRNSLEVLGALSSGQGIAMSNSSFGWWGAYLSRPEATVIAPRPWFADHRINTRDLLEKSWFSLGF